MMEDEMDEQLGYEPYESCEKENYRNGIKKVRSSYGEFEIDFPKDRNSSYKHQIAKKRQKDITDTEQKIISMYAKGLTTREISDQIEKTMVLSASKDLSQMLQIKYFKM